MKLIPQDFGLSFHQSAAPSHYNESADSYDIFNEEKSKAINICIEKILKRYKVKNVLDISCGTGSQVFWMTKAGFDVVGSDFNRRMLETAKRKAAEENLDIHFLEADMRSIRLDASFDAVISIFNAIGHLTKDDFKRTIGNSAKLLDEGGLLVFDIFNLNYLLHEDRITKLTIDWVKKTESGQKRILQFSTINQDGVLASYTTIFDQRDSQNIEVKTTQQTLQVYSAGQLVDLLDQNGFETLEQTDIGGSEIVDINTERIVTVAIKRAGNR